MTAHEVAERINAKLEHSSFSADQCVTVADIEGSFMLIRSAFALSYDGHYLVFAEHHPPRVFHEDEATVRCWIESSVIDASLFLRKKL